MRTWNPKLLAAPSLTSALAALALLASVAPRTAGAVQLRIVVGAQGSMDGTLKLTPCPPDSGLYFCGTEPDAPPFFGEEQIDTGQLLNPTFPVTRIVSQLPTAPVSGSIGAGEARVTANPGSLGARVVAIASGAWYRLSWQDEFGETQDLDFFRETSGAGSASAALDDEITFSGPAGTVGTFHLVMSFDRSFDLSGQGGGSASAQSYVYDPTGAGGTLAIVGISDCTTCGNPQQAASATFQAAAGSTWTLGQALTSVSGTAGANASNVASSIAVEAGNTLHTSIEIQTPGFSITSASGHDYVSAPEPDAGAMALASGGALATTASCRRARRRTRSPFVALAKR